MRAETPAAIYECFTKAMRFVRLAQIFLITAAWIAAGPAMAMDEPEPQEAKAGKDLQRWVFLPVVARTEETGFEGGGYVAYFPNPKLEGRSSVIQFVASTTEREQYKVEVVPDIYFNNGKYMLRGDFDWLLWPANFYGLGADSPNDPELYEASSLSGDITLERVFDAVWYVGARLRAVKETIELAPGGALEEGSIIGATGGVYTGLGLTGAYDTRDNVFEPFTGWYLRLMYINYSKSLGGEYGFSVGQGDVRKYFPLGHDAVFALAAQVVHAGGDVPFRELSTADGEKVLRGIEKGRYRDNSLLCLQAEVRSGKWHNFGATLFAEAGQVAPGMGDFTTEAFRPAYGLGLRYAINPQQRFNIRLDISSVDGHMGLVIKVKEAF